MNELRFSILCDLTFNQYTLQPIFHIFDTLPFLKKTVGEEISFFFFVVLQNFCIKNKSHSIDIQVSTFNLSFIYWLR